MHGANPNHADNLNRTPLMGAAKDGDLEAIELLASAGANLDARDKLGDSAIAHAFEPIFAPPLKPHDPEMVAVRLLELGASCNVQVNFRSLRSYAERRKLSSLLDAIDGMACGEEAGGSPPRPAR